MWLSSREARERMNVSRETLRKLTKSGEIKASKVGTGPTSPLRYHEDDIADYMKRHLVQPSS